MQNKEVIINAFSQQSKSFDSYVSHPIMLEYMIQVIEKLHLKKTDKILEAAAGTCVSSRLIAPQVSSVIAYDVTPKMLEVGKKEAGKEGIRNIDFVTGTVEQMPFDDEAFDLVLTRQSFHHFANMDEPFREMHRVLKKGGRLAIIDLEAAPEENRALNDRIETLRDPSHNRKRSQKEFERLFEKYGLEIVDSSRTDFEMSLDNWCSLTQCPTEVKEEIRSLLMADMEGRKVTGFKPCLKSDKIYFIHRWLLLIGQKNNTSPNL